MAQFNLSRSLFMITEPTGQAVRMLAQIRAGIHGGVTHVLLRRPNDPARDLYRVATTISAAWSEGAPWRLLVHERIDVAVAAGAQGAHLRLDSLPVGPARALLGSGRMLGYSVHTRDETTAAVRRGADYVLFGHVFSTASHPGQPGRGLDALREAVAAAAGIPVVAVGGITPQNVDDVLSAGASGVAVIRAISGASDAEAAARALREALDRADYCHLNPKRRT